MSNLDTKDVKIYALKEQVSKLKIIIKSHCEQKKDFLLNLNEEQLEDIDKSVILSTPKNGTHSLEEIKTHSQNHFMILDEIKSTLEQFHKGN